MYGRGREAQALGERGKSAAAGRAQVVFVEGEAGIGKTRLVTETAAVAKGRGFAVFQGRCEELDRHRPFGALADALGCHRRADDPARAAIGRLLATDTAEVGDGPKLQYGLLEAFVELVEQLAMRQPVLLVVEDLHWADSSTLLALRTLGRRLRTAPLLLAGTLRPSPRHSELERLVATFTNEGGLHLSLGPLDDTAVTALAIEVLDAAPGPRLRRQLSGTGGNPLFVLELLTGLDEQGAITAADGMVEVGEESALPTPLRLTILQRLSALPDASMELLQLASVLGSTVSLADLSQVTGRPLVELLG